MGFVIVRNLIWPVIFCRLHVDQYSVWSNNSYTAGMLTLVFLYCIVTYLQFVWGKLAINNSCKALGAAPPLVFVWVEKRVTMAKS